MKAEGNSGMKEYIVSVDDDDMDYEEVFIAYIKRQKELIRCKDCVYFTPEKSGEHWNICRFYDAPKTADGYCNDAEPKEEKR